MLIKLLDALPNTGALAMLCKTATARKVLRHFWNQGVGFSGSRMFLIDAKAEFGVNVDACLFFVTGERTDRLTASVYPKLEITSKPVEIGYSDGNLVNDVKAYERADMLIRDLLFTPGALV